MTRLARLVTRRPWWVIAVWVVLTAVGGYGAPKATSALTYDFGLPGQPGYETNQQILADFGSGGPNPPLLLVVDAGSGGSGRELSTTEATSLATAASRAVPGARVATWADAPSLRSADGRVGVVLVHYSPVPGPEPYVAAQPALQAVAQQATARLAATGASGTTVTLTGQDVLASSGDSGGGGADVLAETVAGGVGALVVLVLVFGSFLALTPLVVAAASILTTFLAVWGLTQLTDISFIVQFLLSLIGLGVAIDYALLMVTRWREERGAGADGPLDRPTEARAVERALATAGRSVVFSGTTVAVSLAALIALPVPFLRSVGFTGLLIPVVSVAAAVTLLPALLLVAGRHLDWPHRRSSDPESRLWRRVGSGVVRHRWWSALFATVVLLVLASPILGLRLGQPTNDSLASVGGSAGTAVTRLESAGLGAGLTRPVEVVTSDPSALLPRLQALDGVAGAAAPSRWTTDGRAIVDVWSRDDSSTAVGAATASRVREVAEASGAAIGGVPAQDADFVTAVYGNAWWVVALIVVVTFLLLARALRSVVLPLKALLLNVISLSAAYGMSVAIWQHGLGVETLFRQSASGAITVWVPIASFAFLFGLSMDYEVFLLSRIKEEHDSGHSTDEATVHGVARTGRLVTSGALILFLAFVSLSQVPTVEVKILATTLALGIILDATLVRGVLAPALVAGLGRANWWLPTVFTRERSYVGRHVAD